jgi:hypothetical protein
MDHHRSHADPGGDAVRVFEPFLISAWLWLGLFLVVRAIA